MTRTLLLAAAALCVLSGTASAQATRYDLTEMNFDLWCQEQQHLAPERCDKRLPADDAAFQAYRNKIEKYEIPYLQEKENRSQLNRVILHNDPIDHPTEISKPQTDQTPDPDSPPGK